MSVHAFNTINLDVTFFVLWNSVYRELTVNRSWKAGIRGRIGVLLRPIREKLNIAAHMTTIASTPRAPNIRPGSLFIVRKKLLNITIRTIVIGILFVEIRYGPLAKSPRAYPTITEKRSQKMSIKRSHWFWRRDLFKNHIVIILFDYFFSYFILSPFLHCSQSFLVFDF